MRGDLGLKGAVKTDSEMANLLACERVHQSSTQSCKICDNKLLEKQKLKDKNFTLASNKIKSYKF